jgi:hypothetical protein
MCMNCYTRKTITMPYDVLECLVRPYRPHEALRPDTMTHTPLAKEHVYLFGLSRASKNIEI